MEGKKWEVVTTAFIHSAEYEQHYRLRDLLCQVHSVLYLRDLVFIFCDIAAGKHDVAFFCTVVTWRPK